MESGASATSIIFSTGFINFGDGNISDSGNRITSSLAIQVDGVSIVVIAYSSGLTAFVGFVSDECH